MRLPRFDFLRSNLSVFGVLRHPREAWTNLPKGNLVCMYVCRVSLQVVFGGELQEKEGEYNKLVSESQSVTAASSSEDEEERY